MIALAVATDRGLLVPVFVEPDATDPDTFDAELRDVVAAAQKGKVGPAYLGIANASLSNMGGLGVDRFQALITPPQASILALGSIKSAPGSLCWRSLAWLTVHADLTVDHRAETASMLPSFSSP
ncbi:MAG: 2-oxo acid dehydrogenase subunit E2 [Marmoricola sp.]